MSKAAELIDSVIRNGLAQELKRAGYRKAARTWRRRVQDLTQVTNVQGSWTNEGTSGRFTINLGVYYPEAARIHGLFPVKGNPNESDCIVSERIGFLMPVGQDFWWTADADTDLELLGHELATTWSRHALPWLEAQTDPLSAANYMEKKGISFWAAVLSVLGGDRDRGLRLFTEIDAASSATPLWRAHAGEWRERLGFPKAARQ